MTVEGPEGDWAGAAVRFISAVFPPDDGIWDHTFTSAYQMACMVLVALGEATEEEWGATRLVPPRRPTVMPRWDDVCVAVLKLAHQTGRIEFRQLDGTRPPVRGNTFIRLSNPPPVPPPNVSAGPGSGPALADAACLAALVALGLVDGGTWTARAETVLWRDGVSVWCITPANDPRFAEAVDRAIATLPDALRAEMARLVTVTPEDVAASQAHHAAWVAEQRAQFGARADKNPFLAPKDDDRVHREIAFTRASSLDWLFYRQWRLPDGWLSPDATLRALEIFHDPLAIAMRKAVVTRLFPDSDAVRAEAEWEARRGG